MAASAPTVFRYKYFRKQPVFQLLGLPRCQLTGFPGAAVLDYCVWGADETFALCELIRLQVFFPIAQPVQPHSPDIMLISNCISKKWSFF